MNQIQTIPQPYSTYLEIVYNAPYLSATEEHDLAIRYHEKQDLVAAKRLALSHMRYVVKVAKEFRGYGLPEEDLVQEGAIGLMKAIRKFDPAAGVRLISYAMHWIRSEIQEFIIRNWKIVKIATTKSQRKIFFKLRSTQRKLQEKICCLTKNKADEVVARELEVPAGEVRLMQTRLQGKDVSIETQDTAFHGNDLLARTIELAHEESYPEKLSRIEDLELQKKHLQQAFSALDARQADIISRRWLREKKQTLQKIAKEHCLSVERVRQIEKKAISNIKSMLQNTQDSSMVSCNKKT